MLSALLAALWVGPAMSGSWFTPERNGEGFTLQVLENGTAHAIWFTYPPSGAPGQQAWIYAADGRIEGERIRFDGAITTRGPRFGPGYDATRLQLLPWGTLEFRFTSCNEAEVTYAGPAAWGSGTRRLTRLTALAELECAGKRRVHPQGGRTLEGLRNRSGAWFDPAHNGEGWTVEELPDGRSQVYWFTYDDQGEQAWTIGVAPTSGTRMTIEQNLRPVGTRFGASFDSAQVTAQAWGRLDLQLASCGGGTLTYESALAAFGSGTLRPVPLTIPAGTVCLDGMPNIPATGTWSAGPPEPAPAVSESANAVLGSSIYMAGGFGGTRAFKRFDARTQAWTVLPQTPSGRDHGMAAAFGDSVFVVGGNHNGGGNHAHDGWRYVIPENRWEDVPELPAVAQSGAATLGGFIYIGDAEGNLRQFNPRTRQVRFIPTDGRAPRDHSQVVAFQGEIWIVGGRQLGVRETSRVSIYDPASETWRPGPFLQVARAGFALAASPHVLIAAGGEVLSTSPWQTLASVEAIGAGQPNWFSLPSLPTALHGFGAIIFDNAFYTVGGTVVAGAVSNAGIVQVLRW